MPSVKAADQENLDAEIQVQNIQQRRGLQNAYASLLGDQTVQSFAAFTLEEAVDARIEKIEGSPMALRSNELERVSQIEGALLQAVAQIRDIPPEKFKEIPEDDRVNTDPLSAEERAARDKRLSESIADRLRE